MQIYDELIARGLLAQVTDEDEIRDLVNNWKSNVLYRIRLHRRQSDRRSLHGTDPDETDADGRKQTDRPDRRRHHHDR